MNRQTFWNDLAKQGAVLGLLLSLSLIFEIYAQLSGNIVLMFLVVFEWIGVAVLHYILLHRYTRSFGNTFSAEEGFPFGRAYGYVILLSLFAGIVVALAQVVCVNYMIGYEAYIDGMIASMRSVLAQSEMPQHMEPFMRDLFRQLQEAPTPSILQVAWGAVSNTIFFGMIYGLIMAGVLSRSPKPFEKQE